MERNYTTNPDGKCCTISWTREIDLKVAIRNELSTKKSGALMVEVIWNTQVTLPYQTWKLGPSNLNISDNDKQWQFPTHLSGTAIYSKEDQKVPGTRFLMWRRHHSVYFLKDWHKHILVFTCHHSGKNTNEPQQWICPYSPLTPIYATAVFRQSTLPSSTLKLLTCICIGILQEDLYTQISATGVLYLCYIISLQTRYCTVNAPFPNLFILSACNPGHNGTKYSNHNGS